MIEGASASGGKVTTAITSPCERERRAFRRLTRLSAERQGFIAGMVELEEAPFGFLPDILMALSHPAGDFVFRAFPPFNGTLPLLARRFGGLPEQVLGLGQTPAF